MPLSFTSPLRHTPGSHLVSVIVEPDPPAGRAAARLRLKDHLPGDNRQDYAIEVVPALPVLLVDGDASGPIAEQRGTDFLRDALAPARDPTPGVLARVVPIQEFDAGPAVQRSGQGAGHPAARPDPVERAAPERRAGRGGGPTSSPTAAACW